MPYANWKRAHAIRRMESSIRLLERIFYYIDEFGRDLGENWGWWEGPIVKAMSGCLYTRIAVEQMLQALREGVPKDEQK